nr:hypothetical protein [Streptomyces sp. 846.5]
MRAIVIEAAVPRQLLFRGEGVGGLRFFVRDPDGRVVDVLGHRWGTPAHRRAP